MFFHYGRVCLFYGFPPLLTIDLIRCFFFSGQVWELWCWYIWHWKLGRVLMVQPDCSTCFCVFLCRTTFEDLVHSVNMKLFLDVLCTWVVIIIHNSTKFSVICNYHSLSQCSYFSIKGTVLCISDVEFCHLQLLCQ